ncbi:carbohydrate-binding module family 20 domain-containing protein [Streptomyces sp. AGS-58]|uniref:carbohydrate-binding module family 20 domain-containing protein n=1 Tax=unclassified Streptomyces TaxID=2593676 RepID=UPI0035A28D84
MLGVLLTGLLAGTAPHTRATTVGDVFRHVPRAGHPGGRDAPGLRQRPAAGRPGPGRGRPLGTTASACPHWSSTVQLPAGATVQYKYIKRSPTGTLTWESTPDRTLTGSPDVPGTDDHRNAVP